MSEQTHYTKVAITLHWVIAVAIITQLATGLLADPELLPRNIVMKIFQFHKALGLTVLVLSLVRLAWRIGHRPPTYPDTMKKWEKILAHGTHHLFYLFMIGVPLTGWILVSSSSMGFPTSWFGLFIWPDFPGLTSLGENTRETIHEFAEESHGILAYATLWLLGLHIAAALKHHFIDKDNILRRMIPCIKPR